jgi:hypothetical protein
MLLSQDGGLGKYFVLFFSSLQYLIKMLVKWIKQILMGVQMGRNPLKK